MIINFRYHIFTITAIFAALGLGILIGSSFIGHEGLIEEQRKIINNIGADINNLKTENSELKISIENMKKKMTAHRDFVSELLNLLVDDRSVDKYFLLVNNHKYEEEKVNQYNELLKDVGINLKIINEIKKIDPGEEEQVILWKLSPEDRGAFLKLNNNLKKEPLICNKKDFTGLVFTIIESLKNKDENNSKFSEESQGAAIKNGGNR